MFALILFYLLRKYFEQVEIQFLSSFKKCEDKELLVFQVNNNIENCNVTTFKKLEELKIQDLQRIKVDTRTGKCKEKAIERVNTINCLTNRCNDTIVKKDKRCTKN